MNATYHTQHNRTVKILQGILWIVLGVGILSNPSLAMNSLIRIIGIIMVISAIAIGVLSRKEPESMLRKLRMGGALLNLALGLVFIISPGVIEMIFVFLVGFLLLLAGILGASGAYHFERKIFTFAFLRNVLLVLIGLLMLLDPFESAGAIAVLIGIGALLYGISVLF